MTWKNRKKNLFIFIIILISISHSLILAKDNQKEKPMTQLVGSSRDTSKELAILWQMPEKASARDVFLLKYRE